MTENIIAGIVSAIAASLIVVVLYNAGIFQSVTTRLPGGAPMLFLAVFCAGVAGFLLGYNNKTDNFHERLHNLSEKEKKVLRMFMANKNAPIPLESSAAVKSLIRDGILKKH